MVLWRICEFLLPAKYCFIHLIELNEIVAVRGSIQALWHRLNNVMCVTQVATSAGNEGIIYHMSWAPADLGCIAGCTAKNGIFIWSMDKGKVIKRIHDVSVAMHWVDVCQIFCVCSSAACIWYFFCVPLSPPISPH